MRGSGRDFTVSNILIYIDGSFGHEVAARYGLVLTNALGGTCHICSSFENEQERTRKQSSAQRISMRAGEFDLEIKLHIRSGSPLQVVRDVAEEIDPDLVIASLDHDDITERGVRRGSQTVRIMEGLNANVVLARIVNCGLAFSHQKVLFPVARPGLMRSEEHAIIDIFVELVKTYGAELDIFSCVEISPKRHYGVEELSDMQSMRRKELNFLGEEVMKKGVMPGIKVRTCTSPAGEILDFVSKERYDLIFARAPRQSLLSVFRGPEVIEEVLLGTPSNTLIWKPKTG